MPLIEILAASPLLLLFLVAGIGFLLGRVALFGNRLGVAAVLFVGIGFSALDPRLKLPDVVFQLGLVLFVYTIGLSAGPGFVASLKGKGLRDNLFVVAMVTFGALLTLGAHQLLGLGGTQAVGIFAGSLTNTPALAAAVEFVTRVAASRPGPLPTDVVVGYSIAYPASVISFLVTIQLCQRRWRVDYGAELRHLRGMPGVPVPIVNIAIRVTRPEAVGLTVAELVSRHGWRVVFSRIRRDAGVQVPGHATRLEAGDLLTVVGAPEELARVAAAVGEVDPAAADLDRSEIDVRRLMLSNRKLAGLRLRDLHLPRRFGAVVTRIRRGDIDLLPRADLVLELGDRPRVLARREAMEEVARLFGDSVRAVSEIDIASFSLGIAAGILLGLIPIPLGGGITVRLGLAGGPLIVAIIAGARGRTGSFVWGLPYSANLMLRQVGMILFLAGVGTKAGYAFFETLLAGGGLAMLAAGTVIAAATAVLSAWIGYRVLKIPYGILTGMLAAIQTQPATLAYAVEQAGNELPNVGYAATYPAAMVVKIIYIQLMLGVLL